MEETDILPLELQAELTAYPDGVRFLERNFRFQETGEVNRFLESYRKRYYTKQCLAYHNTNNCIEFAVERGDIEMVSATQGCHREIMEMLATIEATLLLSPTPICIPTGCIFMLLPRATADGINKAIKLAAEKRHLEIVEILRPRATDDWINERVGYILQYYLRY